MRFLERRRANAEARLADALIHAHCCTESRRLSLTEAASAAKVRTGFTTRTLWRWFDYGWLEDGWENTPTGARRFYRPTELGLRELGSRRQSS